MRAMLVPRLVAIAFLVVFVILCIVAPVAGAVFGGVGAVVLLPYLVMATAKGHNRRFEAARTSNQEKRLDLEAEGLEMGQTLLEREEC